jgi:magnesium chelatase family protein
MRERVIQARLIAETRFAEHDFKLNSEISTNLLREKFRPRKDGLALLHTLLDSESITARGFHRTIRVAWSIADLGGITTPGKEEIERALELRVGIKGE